MGRDFNVAYLARIGYVMVVALFVERPHLTIDFSANRVRTGE